MANTGDDAYRKAERRIAIALREQAVLLDVSSGEKRRLTDLPESLGQLTQLQQARRLGKE